MPGYRPIPLASAQLFVDTVAVRVVIGIRVICIAMEADGTA